MIKKDLASVALVKTICNRIVINHEREREREISAILK